MLKERTKRRKELHTMYLGKLMLVVSIFLLSVSCAKEKNYIDYNSAKSTYTDGLTKHEIVNLYGEPTGTFDFEDYETWFYEPEDPTEVIEKGEEFTAFSIDIKDNASVRLVPIIIRVD